MKVFICSEDYEKSLSKLEELSKEYDNIMEFRKGKNESSFKTYTGDYYRTIPCIDGMRANRCDKIYIGTEVNDRIVNLVLIPLLGLSNIPYAQRVIYF